MKYLLLLFSLTLISCAKKDIQKEYVKCQIPAIPKINYEVIPENASYDKKLEIILNNCRKLKYERDLLMEAIKICQ